MISKGHEVWPWPSSNSPLDGYRVQELKQMRMVSFYMIYSSDEKIATMEGQWQQRLDLDPTNRKTIR